MVRNSAFFHAFLAGLLVAASGWLIGGGTGLANEMASADAALLRGVYEAPCSCETCCGADWSKIPAICPMPRPGNFFIPPSGPGYFSASDWLHGNCRAKAPPSGYPPFALMPPSFFDADFRYVDKLDPCDRTLVERLKRMQLNDQWMFSTGGQFWLRYMNETNSRLHPASVKNDYTLGRVRVFGDLMYGDSIRLFGEYLWADNFGFSPSPAPPGFNPLPIDIDRGDILNLFVDLKVWDGDGHPVYVRGGRQELLLGSQRLVSTLDWANTRRTFQGVRAFRRGEKWDADVFWVQPVIPDPSSFDQADSEQNFAGTWLTYRAEKGRFLDFYYLYYGNGNTPPALQGIPRAPFDLHTFGSRWAGDKDGFLWDVELAMQLGQRASSDVVAGMATAGVGRQNIHDLNAHVYFYPAPWVTMFVQYHRFWLNHSRDALYGVGGVPVRRDANGLSGTDVGHEIDLVANFHLARYTDLMLGYSKLFGGSFLERTPGPKDSELFHLMFQQKW